MNEFSSENNSNTNGLPVEVKALLEDYPQEEARSLEEIWTLAAHARQFDTPAETNPERFDLLREAVFHEVTQTPKVAVHLRLVTSRTLRIAATLIILVLAGSLLWSRPVIYKAPQGNQRSVQLADGSTVTLNSGSQISHKKTFGSKNRQIKLKGEAFFEVAHHETPFTVETFNGTVTVLGTRFNVRAWDNEEAPETVVVLEQGSVQLASRTRGAAPVVLKPGESSRISGATAPTPPTPINVGQSTAWRVGGLYFVDEPVGVVIDEIVRRFDVEVRVLPRSLRQERVSLRLSEARSAGEALSMIAIARDYTLREANGVFTLITPSQD